MVRQQDVKKIFSETLYTIMEQNPNVYMVDADLMRITGTDQIAKTFPDQYVNVGIAEQNAIGTAAGLASMGKTVFVSAFCGFLGTRASDQCLNTLCYNGLNVKLIGTYAGISSGINGGTHISISDLAAFRSMPGMTVIEVSDGAELAWAVKEAAAVSGPVYIRVPKGPLDEIFSSDTQFSPGKGIVLSEGSAPSCGGPNIALITSGITTAFGIEAAKLLSQKGVQLTHVHMTSVKPMDESLVMQLAATHDIIVTADNHSIIGGLGSAVCEITASKAPVRILRLGVEDMFCEGMTQKELAERHHISPEGIAAAIWALLHPEEDQ